MDLNFDPAPYWNVVEDCLVELHGLKRDDAQQRLASLWFWMRSLPPGIDGNIIYHDEQFNVACDLAGRNLSPDDYQEQYEQIVDRHYPGWRTGYVAQSTAV